MPFQKTPGREADRQDSGERKFLAEVMLRTCAALGGRDAAPFLNLSGLESFATWSSAHDQIAPVYSGPSCD